MSTLNQRGVRGVGAAGPGGPWFGWVWVLAVGLSTGVGWGLSGCGSSSADRAEDARVVLQYWEKWTGFEGDAIRAVVDDFNASQDRIRVEMLTVSQIDRKLMLATAGGNPPDVAGLWSSRVGTFAEKGALTPLNRLLEETGMTRDDYIPVFWDMCEHRGFMWALPSTPATTALHWNRRSFREAGLDPDRPPRSIAELDEMTEQLTVVEVVRGGRPRRVRFPELTGAERAAKDYRILEMGSLPVEPDSWIPLWGYWFGADLVSEDGRTITADSPENLAALRWYAGFAEKYGAENVRRFRSGFGNFASPQNPFLAGRLAMEIQGVWLYNFIEKYAPQLDWDAAPYPSVDPEGLPRVTIAECDVLVIPNGSPHPREAFEFIRYVNSREGMEKLCLGHRKFTALAEVSDGFLRDHPHPRIELFIELAHSPNARPTPAFPLWTEYADEMSAAYDRALQLAVSPEQALEQVTERIQWKQDRNLRRWDRVKKQRLQQWSDYDSW